MIFALALCVAAVSQATKSPAHEAFQGFEWIDLTLRIDWAQRYVSIDGNYQFAIRFHGFGRHYSVTGFWQQGSTGPETVTGSFTQLVGRRRGPIRLRSHSQSWRGEWNRKQGCFELSSKGNLRHLQLWQQLTPEPFRFLEGRLPLGKPHEVPDNLMGTETDTQALYGFPAGFHHIAELANRELIPAHWKKTFYRTWGSEPTLLCSCYYEPGPTGRSVVIEPDSSVPESSLASDLIMSGTRRKGWVGVTINSPKIHG
jgi:hypothetical protein